MVLKFKFLTTPYTCFVVNITQCQNIQDIFETKKSFLEVCIFTLKPNFHVIQKNSTFHEGVGAN